MAVVRKWRIYQLTGSLERTVYNFCSQDLCSDVVENSRHGVVNVTFQSRLVEFDIGTVGYRWECDVVALEAWNAGGVADHERDGGVGGIYGDNFSFSHGHWKEKYISLL